MYNECMDEWFVISLLIKLNEKGEVIRLIPLVDGKNRCYKIVGHKKFNFWFQRITMTKLSAKFSSKERKKYP